jgi:hypothetical protein
MGNPRPTEATSAPLMDTMNIALKTICVKYKFFRVDDGVCPPALSILLRASGPSFLLNVHQEGNLRLSGLVEYTMHVYPYDTTHLLES